MFVCLYACVHVAGRLRIVFAPFGSAGDLSVTIPAHPDRYEWFKRLPNLSERHISSQKSVHIEFVKFQDEGYYCCYWYQQNQLLGKNCFKLVVLGK